MNQNNMKTKFLSLALCVSLTAGMLICSSTSTAASLGGTLGSAATIASTANSTNDASASGKNCGAALKGLYTQYKSDGKLDMKNTTNLVNIASLATSMSSIKGHTKDTDFYKQFAAGMVSGSSQTVTSFNVDNVVSSLSNINLSSLTSTSTASSSTKSAATSALSSLLGSLK